MWFIFLNKIQSCRKHRSTKQNIRYLPGTFHWFGQAWSIVEAGTLMGCASWCMDRFQRNVGVRPGSCVLIPSTLHGFLPILDNTIGGIWVVGKRVSVLKQILLYHYPSSPDLVMSERNSWKPSSKQSWRTDSWCPFTYQTLFKGMHRHLVFQRVVCSFAILHAYFQYDM